MHYLYLKWVDAAPRVWIFPPILQRNIENSSCAIASIRIKVAFWSLRLRFRGALHNSTGFPSYLHALRRARYAHWIIYPLAEHPEWCATCTVSDASPSRTRLALWKSPICCGAWLCRKRKRRPSFVAPASWSRYSCNAVSSRGEKEREREGGGGEKWRELLGAFANANVLKMTFPRCTLARCITVNIYARDRCAQERNRWRIHPAGIRRGERERRERHRYT